MFKGDFDTEEEYLMSLKKDDSYHFSIPFEYVKVYNENSDEDDEHIWGETTMEVDVEWSDAEYGYIITYSCEEEDEIVGTPGNYNSLNHCFNDLIEMDLREELESYGIYAEAIATIILEF